MIKLEGKSFDRKKEVVIFQSPHRRSRSAKKAKYFLKSFERLISNNPFGFLPKINRTLFKQTKLLILKILKMIKILLFPIKLLIIMPIVLFDLIRLQRVRITKTLAKRKKQKERQKKTGLKPTFFYKLKFFFFGAIASSLLVFIPMVGYIFLSDLPNPSSLSVSYIPKTTKIYDRNNNLLYEIYANQNRTLIKLYEVPKSLIDATVAIEDKDFYSHPGFDLRGILRALVSNLQTKDLQGGSTITQQLIKSAFLTPSPTLTRKIKEVFLAFWAERIYTKDQILEMYFNYVPYGGTAWGVEAASEVYFGKKVSDLTLAESAFLAGLPRAPSIYSPNSSLNNMRWKNRQKEVLDAMVRTSLLKSVEAKNAYAENLVFKTPSSPIKAPHFVMYVKDLLVEKYGLWEVERGGLAVKTSIDLKLQQEAEKIVAEQVESNFYLNIQNGASLITNPKTGEILAMVGSKDYFDQESDGNVNVTLAKRQPGSTIKVVTYSLALTSGLTEATIIDDSPISIPDGDRLYTPVNYDGKFHGKLPLRLVFANSLNIPAVRTAQKLGVGNIVEFGQNMGISSWNNGKDYGLSITLGGGEVTMVDLATAYGTIANDGKRVDINPLLEVKDYKGQKIYEKTLNGKQVVDQGVAFIIADILSDNRARSMEFGLNSPLNISGRRVSVKTGTTDNKRDNWTIGFNSDFLVASWVGNNDNTPMSPSLTSGITGAAPMWNKIMTLLLNNSAEKQPIIPANIVRKRCYGYEAYFIRGTENLTNCGNSSVNIPTLFPSIASPIINNR